MMKTHIKENFLRRTATAALALLISLSCFAGIAVLGTLPTYAEDGDAEQFSYTEQNDTVTITAYSGNSIAVAVPATINGLPVTAIADGVFESHTELVRLHIADGVQSIGAAAFRGCSGLLELTLPDSVTHIGDSAFERCTSLYFADVGDGLRTLGASAFAGCDALLSLTLPVTLESVGDAALADCGLLEDVIIVSPDAELSSDIFGTPASEIRVYAPSGSDTLGAVAANGHNIIAVATAAPDGNAASVQAAGLTYKTTLGGVEITGCRTSAAALILPDTIDGAAVVAISERSFASGCDSLQAVMIPCTVTSIGDGAFRGLSVLRYVRMPRALRSNIGQECFRGCVSLRSIYIPEGSGTVGINAFSGCSSLTCVTLPSTLTRILSGAFSGCTSLARLYAHCNMPECSGQNSTDELMPFGAVPLSMVVYTDYDRSWLTGSALWYPNGRSYSGGYARAAVPTGCFYVETAYTAPSCHSEGSQTLTCPFCGAYRTVSFPKTEHNFVSVGITDGIETFRCTGCTANYTLRHIEFCDVVPEFDISGSGVDMIKKLNVSFRGRPLLPEADYTYTVTENQQYGRLEVTLTGIGEYTGTYEWGFSAYTGDALRRYTVHTGDNVTYGIAGGGLYYRGDTVRLTPAEPVPNGREAVWTIDDGHFISANNGYASFTMPAHDVTVSLTLKEIPVTDPPDTEPVTTPPDTEPITTPPDTEPITTPSDTTPDTTVPHDTTTREPYSHTVEGLQYVRTAILWGVILFVSLAAFVGLCIMLFRKK